MVQFNPNRNYGLMPISPCSFSTGSFLCLFPTLHQSVICSLFHSLTQRHAVQSLPQGKCCICRKYWMTKERELFIHLYKAAVLYLPWKYTVSSEYQIWSRYRGQFVSLLSWTVNPQPYPNTGYLTNDFFLIFFFFYEPRLTTSFIL